MSRARRLPLAAAGVAVVLTAAVDVKGGIARNYEFLHGYEALRRGMTRAEVETLLLAPAAHECRYGAFRVSYYVRQPGVVLGLVEGPLPNGLPTEVALVSDLPEIYAAVQVAYADEDRLAAFTWNGETHYVVAANGRWVRGSTLRILGPDLLPRGDIADP